MRWLTVRSILVALGLLCASLPSVAEKDCRVVAPPQWSARTLSWDGSCRGGRAHGPGVLRAYLRGEETIVFYGRIEQGELAFGVIEGSDGYQAGRFVRGSALPNQSRQAIINAFDQASAAAKAYAQRLRAAGNAPSAAFYARKAAELAQQMD